MDESSAATRSSASVKEGREVPLRRKDTRRNGDYTTENRHVSYVEGSPSGSTTYRTSKTYHSNDEHSKDEYEKRRPGAAYSSRNENAHSRHEFVNKGDTSNSHARPNGRFHWDSDSQLHGMDRSIPPTQPGYYGNPPNHMPYHFLGSSYYPPVYPYPTPQPYPFGYPSHAAYQPPSAPASYAPAPYHVSGDRQYVSQRGRSQNPFPNPRTKYGRFPEPEQFYSNPSKADDEEEFVSRLTDRVGSEFQEEIIIRREPIIIRESDRDGRHRRQERIYPRTSRSNSLTHSSASGSFYGVDAASPRRLPSDSGTEGTRRPEETDTPEARPYPTYLTRLYGYRHRQRITNNPTTIQSTEPFGYLQTSALDRATKNLKRSPREHRQPIFQVESFIASPLDEKRLHAIYERRSGAELLKLPVEFEYHAGVILTIYSAYIISAIEKVAGRFPGLIESGEELIVPEPFCAFLYYREQLLQSNPVVEAPTTAEKVGTSSTAENVEPQPDHKEGVTNEERISKLTASHIQVLFSFLDEQYLSSVQREKSMWAERQTCTFEWVWLFFAPKTLVYEATSIHSSTMRAFYVRTFRLEGLFSYNGRTPTVNERRLGTFASTSTTDQPLQSITISVTFLVHDGRSWIPSTTDFSILPFKGEKPITDLPIFPASFFRDTDDIIRNRLIERGRRYQKLGSRGEVDYHGDTLSGVKRRLDGRIIVDSETFNYEPHLVSSHFTRSEKDKDEKDERDQKSRGNPLFGLHEVGPRDSASNAEDGGGQLFRDVGSQVSNGGSEEALDNENAIVVSASGLYDLSDEEYMICAPVIWAYILKERDWVVLAVESISDCVYEDRMIDDLQISQEARNLVQALSHNFSMTSSTSISPEQATNSKRKPWSADFVPGKGGGRIILLHGKPGVGKTSTAECIAELTKRPLLTITCGDLGTDAMSVDRELTRWLRLGTLWNAVLLFDEADVFLESRALGDIDRNSLVSVFLRALEYYQGLMFLTTNRIGSFDEAIISRIHVVLHLPNLSHTDRERIWNTSFRKLEKERPDISVEYSLINYAYHDVDIRKLDWNGREIRNAFNTMIALAEWDAQRNNRYTKDGKVEVRREHLQEVAQMSGTFKQYLESLRAMEHEEYMKSLGLRDDKFRAKTANDS